MKKLLFAMVLLAGWIGKSQVGINTISPDSDSDLTLGSTDKGLLLNRVNLTGTANATPLVNHVSGMVVYNTATAGDVTPGYYYNNGSQWIRIEDTDTSIYEDNGTIPTSTARTVAMNGGSSLNFDSGTLFIEPNDDRVGIGTTTPDRKLHVLGSSNGDIALFQSSEFGIFQGLVVQDNGGSNTSRFVISPGTIGNNSSTTLAGVPSSNTGGLNSVTFDCESSNFDIYAFGEGQIRPTFNFSTTLGTTNHRFTRLYAIYSTSISSDVRLKENIRGLSYGLDEVMLLTPISYTLKEDTSKSVQLGFKAQEVAELVPEIVEAAEGTGMLSMSYTELIPVLTKAIQQQQERIQLLETLLETQDLELGKLKTGLKRLETMYQNDQTRE